MDLFAILTQLNVLLQLMCVIIVAAYLLTRTRVFAEALDGNASPKTIFILICFFGALSVYGSVSGIEFMGSVVNVRDLGPMLAGLLAGPWAGLGAGLIGAAFRLTMGGLTVYACSVAAVFAGLFGGLFGGLIWLYSKKRFPATHVAVLFAILMEAFHMALVLVMVTPFDTALAVVSRVFVPMAVANAAGMFVFCFIVENLKKERKIASERDALMRETKR